MTIAEIVAACREKADEPTRSHEDDDSIRAKVVRLRKAAEDLERFKRLENRSK